MEAFIIIVGNESIICYNDKKVADIP